MSYADQIAVALRTVAPEGRLFAADVALINELAANFTARAIVPTKTGLADPAAFFSFIRSGTMFGRTLDQGEVEGCKAILTACGNAALAIADTAYVLATTYHETAGTMQPIKEYGGDAYFKRMYDIEGARPAKARELGNLTPGDGAKYPGRGYPQLTGKKNYAHAGEEIGLDLVGNPELALKPEVSAHILVIGMREGWFTGRHLDDDLPRTGPGTLADFVPCRDIINGTDKAEKVAEEAIAFQTGLEAGKWGAIE